MSPLRVAVVDDEPLARRRIVRLLRGEDAEVVAVCTNGREAVEAIAAHKPDLVFLDVQMPEMDGFGVIDAVGPERMPAVVFVTAYDQYALRAFEVHALDYLLKPFDADRLHDAFRRAREALRRDEGGDADLRLLALLDQIRGGDDRGGAQVPAARPYLDWVMVKARGRVQFVRTSDVRWIEAEGNYARLHVGTENFLIREKMGTLETRLDPSVFLRVHRSSIVNLHHVRELRPWFSGDYVVYLKDGTELRLSRGYRDKLGDRIGEYM